MKRRKFLELATAAIAVSSVAELRLTAQPSAQPKAAPKALNAHEADTLLKMSRNLYPHDRLDDTFYQKVVADLDAEAAKAPITARLLRDGLAKLDVGTARFVDLSSDAQVNALKKIETTEFFQKVRGTTSTAIYNNPEVWKQFGYQGPSYQRGGYNGGLLPAFDDLKWLPDPPETASPKPARRVAWLSTNTPTIL